MGHGHGHGGEEPDCNGEPIVLGRQGLRIASVFILLVASFGGALLPILLSRQSKMRISPKFFFVLKFVGTGVIITTAWLHLLEPALDQLGDECVGQRWPSMASYPWALCIGLMTVMVMFFVELIAMSFGEDDHDEVKSSANTISATSDISDAENINDELAFKSEMKQERPPNSVDIETAVTGIADRDKNEGKPVGGLAGQLTSIFILEFGVIFHSVFIGLTLGTVGADKLNILLIVLVFHQMFEGLGLGSRLATAPWPKGKSWLPFVLALGFGLSTPIGIAAGIGARPDNAATQKLTNGIFDAISAGILMYTGLVELLAHEFMFNPAMRRAPLKVKLSAFACIAFGVVVMAVLAVWA
ncbi:hypothetical protein CDD82_3386 [Ophiocordyceps australis]|uniref:Uncharacterized protein n=2 Tax=Ophiocordyceps australis TaxID=1399860 RepID=A0A2C5ZCG2_9HYPO|nr:hypothetical protein CDD82_3386 [Ophiocordyceps australis]